MTKPKQMYKRILCLPIYAGLEEEHLNIILDTIKYQIKKENK